MLILQRTVKERGGKLKERKKERKKSRGGGGGGGTLTSSRKDWAEFYGCIK